MKFPCLGASWGSLPREIQSPLIGFFAKPLHLNCIRCAGLHRTVLFANPTPCGCGRGKVAKENILLGIEWNVQIYTEAIISNLSPLGRGLDRGSQFRKKFDINYMKCLDGPEKSGFTDFTTIGVGWGWGVKLTKTILLENAWNVQICTQKSSFPTIQPNGVEWKSSCKKKKGIFRRNSMKCPDLKR